MTKVHTIKVELLTENAFGPIGEITDAKDRRPDFRGMSGTQIWAVDFQMDGRLQVGFVRVQHQGLTFKAMEQHHGVTQGFIPMGGPPSVVAMAPPTDRNSIPSPEDLRAFLLDGSKGYVLKRNTWHSLDRFPLHPPGGDWVVLTDWETTEDLKASGLKGARLTRTVDFEERFGVNFQFALE